MLDFLKMDLSNNIAILIIILMFFFSLYLITQNKKLKSEVKNLKLLEKEIFNNTKQEESKNDVISINNISKEIKDKQPSTNSKISKNQHVDTNIKSQNKNSTTNHIKSSNIKKDISNPKLELYQNLEKINNTNNPKEKEQNTKQRTITTEQRPKNKKSTTDIKTTNLDLNDYIKQRKTPTKKTSTTKDNQIYLKEISKKMAKELQPQTIELTDYEKDQEENAIISYQELLDVKDKIKIIDDEETVDFIEELKKLRNSLN